MGSSPGPAGAIQSLYRRPPVEPVNMPTPLVPSSMLAGGTSPTSHASTAPGSAPVAEMQPHAGPILQTLAWVGSPAPPLPVGTPERPGEHAQPAQHGDGAGTFDSFPASTAPHDFPRGPASVPDRPGPPWADHPDGQE